VKRGLREGEKRGKEGGKRKGVDVSSESGKEGGQKRRIERGEGGRERDSQHVMSAVST